MRQKVIIRFQ